MGTAQKAAWIVQKESSKGDLRLLGDFRDGQNKRYLDFKAGAGKMRNSKIDDWPLVGPRVVLEVLTSVREGTDLTAYHLTWAQASGVSCYSAAVHEHKNLCDMLRVGISTDQIDLSNLLMAEFAVRRLVQIENQTTLDWTSSWSSRLGKLGRPTRSASMLGWLGAERESECAEAVAVYREEFGFGRGRSGGHGPGEQDQRARGRGRGNPKGKPKAGDGGAASSGAWVFAQRPEEPACGPTLQA